MDLHDRALLLHGAKRDAVLTLDEVRQYGSDSFADPDYIRIYGMPPGEWHRRGIRLLGRTAVECTRDALADLIGRDIGDAAAAMPDGPRVAIDPFAGSCNTLYWILKHVTGAVGIACELDPQVFALSKRNVQHLDRSIELIEGDYRALLGSRRFPEDCGLIFFIAPPWGTALDEAKGLDLRRTTPPITEIISQLAAQFPRHKLLFATQVYEKVDGASLAEVQRLLDWTRLRVYGINSTGRNHGIVLGTKGFRPKE
jgi:hypothetical protein